MTETRPDSDLYTDLRKIPAIAALPVEDFESLARTVYSELELRVGTALSEGLSDAQMEEFENLLDYEQAHPELQGQGPTLAWLQTNRPHYRDTVQNLTDALVAETKAQLTPTPH